MKDNIIKRNKLATRLLSLSLLFAIISDIINKTPIQQIIILLAIGLTCIGLSLFMNTREKTEAYVRYVILIGIYVLTYFLISSSQSIGDYIILYFSLAFISLYHDYKLIILAGIINLIFTNYFYFAFPDTMFYGLGSDVLGSLNLYLIITSLILAFQSKIGANMTKDLESSNEKSQQNNAKLGLMLDNINRTLDVLTRVNKDLTGNIQEIESSSANITKTFNEISLQMEAQAESESEINLSINHINDEIVAISMGSKDMSVFSNTSVADTISGNNEINLLNEEFNTVGINIIDTVKLVEDLKNQTNQIESILDSISDTADQTSLLSLNASIEAARAGEEGRGFAIVANEISKLAQVSAQSTEEITLILNDIKDKVEFASNKVGQVEKSFNSSKVVIENVEELFENIDQNMANINSQALDIENKVISLQNSSGNIVNETMTMASTTQEINASVIDVAADARRQDEEIEKIVSNFNEIGEIIEELEGHQ